MRKEYDFSSGIRGKHSRKLEAGHETRITRADGSTATSVTRPVILDPDLQKIFKDSKAVNKALRGLVSLVPTDPT